MKTIYEKNAKNNIRKTYKDVKEQGKQKLQ